MDALIGSAIMSAARMGTADAVANFARRYVLAALGAVAAAVFVTASLGCAAAALWIFAVPQVGPVGAPLVVSGIFLALALAVAMVSGRGLKRGRRPPPSPPTPDAVLADAMRLFKGQKAAALMAALVAGLAAGSGQR
jgi:hypothetical protein